MCDDDRGILENKAIQGCSECARLVGRLRYRQRDWMQHEKGPARNDAWSRLLAEKLDFDVHQRLAHHREWDQESYSWKDSTDAAE